MSGLVRKENEDYFLFIKAEKCRKWKVHKGLTACKGSLTVGKENGDC